MGENGETGRLGKRAAKAGLFACSLLVFLCGYYAMKTDDWTRIVGFSLLAVAAGVVASAFAKRAR